MSTRAQLVIACHDIEAALDFYVDRLGFQVDSIFPAESPTVAVLSGHGLCLRLDPEATANANLRLLCDDPAGLGGPGTIIAPDGTTVEVVDGDAPLELPPVEQSFVLQQSSSDADWTLGRAGMRYRDLIPGRQGGRFIGSHIHIPDAGPVPDYVHFHKVRFQMIFCLRGWVRLVYEDQGEPFVMYAGDCALQPPRIRHRVLECSANMEVVEIGCPALHETCADPQMSLPTAFADPCREFDGQRFTFHRAEQATWIPARRGFERRPFGFYAATGGLAEASVLRPVAGPSQSAEMSSHDGEFHFTFVVDGTVALIRDGQSATALNTGDCFVMPSGTQFGFGDASADLQLLQVTLPAAAGR